MDRSYAHAADFQRLLGPDTLRVQQASQEINHRDFPDHRIIAVQLQLPCPRSFIVSTCDTHISAAGLTPDSEIPHSPVLPRRRKIFQLNTVHSSFRRMTTTWHFES